MNNIAARVSESLPPKAKVEQIVAAEKIIADISSGIYRSPASALKELISNAYDADAETVTITTDAPNFRSLVIKDDGSGMTIEKFLDVLTHIGGSKKRMAGEESPVFKRKLIGRIGIGFLAIAQLANRFFVSSKVRGRSTRFLAEVNLEPYHKNDAALRQLGKLDDEGKVTIGAVSYIDDIPETKDEQYTIITVPDAKKGLISEMTNALRKAVGAHESISIKENRVGTFSDMVQALRGARRADLLLDGYYYMLWELGLLAPVNYCRNPGLFAPERKIVGLSDLRVPKIEKFKVIVDRMEIFRPQSFPSLPTVKYDCPDPKVYPIHHDRTIAGRRLSFSGYVYVQQPAIMPEELKGIHIRIRDVGIGRYDKSWFGYPFDEGLKFGQVTGEVYVDDGLEAALNIDRDSFRETDVHFQALRAYLWDFLRAHVFPDFKARTRDYRRARESRLASETDDQLIRAVMALSSPWTGEIKVAKVKEPSIGAWLEIRDEEVRVNKDKLEQAADRVGLDAASRDRFLRVLRVLISGELLDIPTEDELDSLLEALMWAIKD